MTQITIMVDILLYFWAYLFHFLLVPFIIALTVLGFLSALKRL